MERIHGEPGEMVQTSGWQSRWLYCQHQSQDLPVCNAAKIEYHGLLMCPVHDRVGTRRGPHWHSPLQLVAAASALLSTRAPVLVFAQHA